MTFPGDLGASEALPDTRIIRLHLTQDKDRGHRIRSPPCISMRIDLAKAITQLPGRSSVAFGS